MPRRPKRSLTRFPKLVRQLHPTKNGKLSPRDVAPGSDKLVWWKCSKARDHEWQSSPRARTRNGSKGLCPFCTGRRVCRSNSLASCFPKIAKTWHPAKNQELGPGDVTARSAKRVWWRCKENKAHEWETQVSHRTGGGTGCPYCTGFKVSADNCLATVNRKLAADWHPTKNAKLTARDVTAGSGKAAWWRCGLNPRHVWRAVVADRGRGDRCPKCNDEERRLTKSTVANPHPSSLLALHPDVADEWHPKRNGKKTPANVRPGSDYRAWWRCGAVNSHVWRVRVWNRAKKQSGCPYCAGRRPGR